MAEFIKKYVQALSIVTSVSLDFVVNTVGMQLQLSLRPIIVSSLSLS
jgi:hypothetical protein